MLIFLLEKCLLLSTKDIVVADSKGCKKGSDLSQRTSLSLRKSLPSPTSFFWHITSLWLTDFRRSVNRIADHQQINIGRSAHPQLVVDGLTLLIWIRESRRRRYMMRTSIRGIRQNAGKASYCPSPFNVIKTGFVISTIVCRIDRPQVIMLFLTDTILNRKTASNAEDLITSVK